MDLAHLGLPGRNVSWKTRRDNMKDVCHACHGTQWVDNFYEQYDALIEQYHDKFARPGEELMRAAQPLLKPAKFSNKLDFIWFELWHHEGRRARHGAAMMGPDYTHWHGMYEVARNFYTHMIPEIEHLIDAGKRSQDPADQKAAGVLEAKLHEVLNSPNHRWYLNKMDPVEVERRGKAAEEFRKRYH